MESTHTNIHYYKSQLQNVIENLEKLEQVQRNELNLVASEVDDLMKQTTEILANLEQPQPISKIQKVLQKRKRKRQRAKLKRKLKADKNLLSKVNTTAQQVPMQVLPKPANQATTSKIIAAQKPHQQLKSYRDANRFLKTFELLELLHATRSQDAVTTREFAEKLAKLRTVWNVIRFENRPDYSAAQNVENQWNSVLFGTNEKSFFKQKHSITDLISIRRKWDSYITSDAKVGTTIPAKWVLPPENADERWQHYQIQ